MLPLAGFPEGRVLAGEAYSLPTPGSEGPPACVPGPAPGSGRTGSISHVLLSGFPGDASGKESACQCRRHKRHGFDPWVGKIPWRRAWQPTPVFLPGESPDRGAWWATVHRVAKNRTRQKRLRMHATRKTKYWVGQKIHSVLYNSIQSYRKKWNKLFGQPNKITKRKEQERKDRGERREET